MQKKINIGIIGCGHWGPNFVRNFSNNPSIAEISVCDSRAEKLNHIKALYPRVKAFHNYQQLFNAENLHAVVISTPAVTHYKITREAIKRDFHILVEKPISVNTRQARELISLARKRKRILMVGHTFLYNPAVQKIREILKRQELGKIFYIHSRRTNLGPLRQDVNAIWDLSPHDISIINYILNSSPLEVSAHAQRFLSHKLEDVGFVICKYPKNILAHIHVSWLDPKKIRELTIIGSKKMLVYDDISAQEPIKLYDKGVMKKRYDVDYKTFKEFQLIIREGEVSLPQVVKAEPLNTECRHFIDCVLHNKRPDTDGENGLEVLRVLEAIDTSLKNNSRKVFLRK
ncbi:MAG: Gfo/Idh/MocA family oxidoreductase [Candidatus Omnitrophica bacterium]|nr:Gfo/Idh/MocA family oxidoreductase [Candidatus Omnitrophota bacterium]